MMTTRGVRAARWGGRTSHGSPRYSPWTGHGGRSRRAGPRAVFRAVGTPPGPARPRQRGAVHLPPGRPAARVGGVARLHPSHPRAGDHIGYGSLFIVLLVAGFAGAVTSLQTGYQFTGTLPLYYAGAVISESMILELGPVLTARSEEHTSELQSRPHLVCRLLLEKKKAYPSHSSRSPALDTPDRAVC